MQARAPLRVATSAPAAQARNPRFRRAAPVGCARCSIAKLASRLASPAAPPAALLGPEDVLDGDEDDAGCDQRLDDPRLLERAAKLFDDISTSEDFVEFLTLPAYELLD